MNAHKSIREQKKAELKNKELTTMTGQDDVSHIPMNICPPRLI